jgi:osmotically-inducible protein OsmY
MPMSVNTIEAGIKNTLDMDPRVRSADEIAVEAIGSSVRLRGTVGSFAQRRAAVKDARNTPGVDEVLDELQVRLQDEYAREDAEIRGAALQRIMWDSELPADALDVRVEDGWVTLMGEVYFQFQSDDAFDDVATLTGVLGITNEIRVIEAV